MQTDEIQAAFERGIARGIAEGIAQERARCTAICNDVISEAKEERDIWVAEHILGKIQG